MPQTKEIGASSQGLSTVQFIIAVDIDHGLYDYCRPSVLVAAVCLTLNHRYDVPVPQLDFFLMTP